MSSLHQLTPAERYSLTMTTRRTHLVPTVTVNKNGVTTTVHKKPASSSAATMKLPAPAAFTDQQKAMRVRDLSTVLDTDLQLSPEELFKLRNKLDSYTDPTTYDLIQTAAEHNNEQLVPEGNFLYTVITTYSEQNVRETCHYGNLIANDLGTQELHGYVNGLHALDQYKNMNLEELTGDDLTTTINLIDIAATLRREDPIQLTGWSNAAVTFRKPELAQLILENVQHTASIINYIEERHSADPEGLRECLNHTTALNNGVL